MIEPSDTTAERALIGSCLIDTSVFFRSNVNTNDFYEDRHKIIWKAIEQVLQHHDCDYVTLINELKAQNQLDNIGGASYITSLVYASPTSLNAESYADIVLDRANRRNAIHAAESLVNAAIDYAVPFDPAPHVESALRSSRFSGRKNKDENLSAFADWYIGNLAHPGKLSGLSTGLDGLDKMTDGLEPGTTLLLSGKPKLGKSMFADQIALSVARLGHAVVIYSLEISDVMIINRWISVITEIPAYRIKRGDLKSEEQEKIATAMAQLQGLDLHIVYDDQLTTSNIRADLMRRKTMGHGVELIVVDYSGKLRDAPERGEDDLDRQAKCIGKIRSIGSRMNCAVILVHTLNKTGDVAGRMGAQYDVDNIAAFYQTKNTPDTPEGKMCVTLEMLAQRDQNSVGIGNEIRLIRKRELPWFSEVE